MSSHTHLYFNSSIGIQKPENIINRGASCPFCEREKLKDIIDQKGEIILLKNKYPVLEETYPLVLIETEDCDSELSLYRKDHLFQLIDFGVSHWLRLLDSHEFRSVIFFKNHGPKSGGSIRHPHMQIIGLNHMDSNRLVEPAHFEGILIAKSHHVEWNLSTSPRMGFYEFNVVSEQGETKQMAEFIQRTCHYILNHFYRCDSYNLFFYQVGDKLIAKIIPRFVTSPLFVGYSIPQVAMNLEDIVRSVQKLYV
ncbi:DUF4931 domain-containing protein [Ammoniphilus sp. CFH 90114]|uniref:DUF4931 domain-containing protein n=1 Tax=Ammoniphilus sp. CFH 90114 TaxID=2493665 RepID=UPI00100DD906|nr:DUF4931 domain-containing protein [Ammoniphilus sp. CFH 90114]RXT02352.1 DUF4931 domain-containing protein [Ammoniphilus sp. CFH 90114]